ncbi:hypothetical protein ACO1O0_001134 [Amphichorda felina]
MYTTAIFATLTALAAAGPVRLSTRGDDVVQCSLTGWERLSNSVTYVPGAPAMAGNGADSGFDLGVEGGDDAHWGCKFGEDNCNPNAMDGQTIPADTAKLDHDIEWKPKDGPSIGGCTCTYAGNEYEGDVDGDVFTGFMYNEGTNKCTCTFPCIPQ